MTLIQSEQNAAKEYKFATIDGRDHLVELCRRNVALAEAAIRNDSAYLKSSDKEAGPRGSYEGSTAYWMLRLKDIVVDGNRVSRDNRCFEEVLKNAINSVDRENSTRLNADGVGRDEMFNRLNDMKNRLEDCLKNPRPDYEIMRVLVDLTHPKDDRHKARRNLSFASKFCQEACFYLFDGLKEQDNFSKYDEVVRKVLPLYLSYYRINDIYTQEFEAKDINAYMAYQKAIDAIRDKLDENNKISRNGFDHLIWYYFKGRLSLLKGVNPEDLDASDSVTFTWELI